MDLVDRCCGTVRMFHHTAGTALTLIIVHTAGLVVVEGEDDEEAFRPRLTKEVIIT